MLDLIQNQERSEITHACRSLSVQGLHNERIPRIPAG